MNINTYYLIGMVISTILTILIYFVSKRQLAQATSDSRGSGYLEGFFEGIIAGEEREREERRIKHRDECKKSYAKIKKRKTVTLTNENICEHFEEMKNRLEDTSVIAESLKRITPDMKKKVYIKFKEGNKKSLEKSIKEAERLGYKKWDNEVALRFEGEGTLALNEDGEYYTSISVEKLKGMGYKEHKILETNKQ